MSRYDLAETVRVARVSMRCLALEVPAPVWVDVNAKVERLAGEAERLRRCLEVVVEMSDYTYTPHEFGVIARAALEASE